MVGIFSFKDFTMLNISYLCNINAFGIKAVSNILNLLSFDNKIPIEYFNKSITQSETFVIFSIMHAFYIMKLLILKDYRWSESAQYLMLPVNVFVISVSFMPVIIFIVLVLPFVYMFFKNLYNIIKHLKYQCFKDILYLLALYAFGMLPFVGLKFYKYIIENMLTFKDGWTEYYKTNISANKIVNLGFYSYGFVCSMGFIVYIAIHYTFQYIK
jgi:hypothetical protein